MGLFRTIAELQAGTKGTATTTEPTPATVTPIASRSRPAPSKSDEPERDPDSFVDVGCESCLRYRESFDLANRDLPRWCPHCGSRLMIASGPFVDSGWEGRKAYIQRFEDEIDRIVLPERKRSKRGKVAKVPPFSDK